MNILKRYEENKPEGTSEKIVFSIIDEMLDRSGFDNWWHGIDSDIQEEILNDLVQTIEAKGNK